MSESEFLTIESVVSVENVIKKSRFLGWISPIVDEADAEAKLTELRTLHKSASHNCFAYTVGLGVPVERFSDAGEPSGTAGRPILVVIRRRGLRQALIVVTRYFGGVLLGASGLTRAYAETSAMAVDAAVLLRNVQMQPVNVTCDYEWLGKLEYELTKRGYTLMDPTYTDTVSFRLWVQVSEGAALVDQLAEWTSGRSQVVVGETVWVGIRPDGSYNIT